METFECFVPFTYDFESMKLEALHRFACAPYRLGGAFLGKGVAKTTAHVFELDTAGHGPPPQYAMYLVPGGRWLLYTDRGYHNQDAGLARISCADMTEVVSGDESSVKGNFPCRSFELSNPVETWPTIHAVQGSVETASLTVAVSYLLHFPM